MSCNSISSNPTVLAELRTAVGGSDTLISGSTSIFTVGPFQTFNTSFNPTTATVADKPVMIITVIKDPEGVDASGTLTYRLFLNGSGTASDTQTTTAQPGTNLEVTFISVLTPIAPITTYMPQIACPGGVYFQSTALGASVTSAIVQ